MTRGISLEPDESIESALQRFAKQVARKYDRRWYKRRYGYYEKPSALKHKKDRFQELPNEACRHLWLKIGLQAQFERSGPNAIGR
jgi:ribosomal protein S21